MAGKGNRLLVYIGVLAHRFQTLVQEAQFRYQVTPASGLKLGRVTRPDLLADTVYRSHQFDFIDRETHVFQNTLRRQRIDMDIGLAHELPQLKFEEAL